MRLVWTDSALSDLVRLHAFLAAANLAAASRVVRNLQTAAQHLPQHPSIGTQLSRYLPRDVRRVIVGPYEMRYEISDNTLYLLRLWHTRERR